MSAPSPLPEEARLAFDKHLLAVLESLHEGFLSLDASWCCTSVNRTAERLLRKRREDLLGKNLWEVFPELVGSLFWKTCCQATETQKRMEVEDLSPVPGQCGSSGRSTYG